MIVPAKQFEGELWVKATDHQRAIAAVKKQQAVGAAWQGLTDEEMAEVLTDGYGSPEWTMDDVRAASAIESKLKEKNT